MNFSDQGFMCWWVGTSEYDIIEVTENILKVRINKMFLPGPKLRLPGIILSQM